MTYQQAEAAPRSDRSFLFDLISGLVLTAFCGLPLLNEAGPFALSAALTLPWIIRRRQPVLALSIATLAALLQVMLRVEPLFAIIAVPMYVYSFARWSDKALARLALGIALVGSIIGPSRWLLATGNPGFIQIVAVLGMASVACAATVSSAYVIGRRRRERADRAAAVVEARIERERLMRAEQEQRAQVAAIDERNRIARELHDIVAHSLSVIVVQAEGGKAIAAKKPERAPEVLNTIAETSREALQEMRQMVGLLRSGGTLGGNRPGGPEHGPGGVEPTTVMPGAHAPAEPSPESYLPAPTLVDLPDLVAKTGDGFTLTEYGDRPTVSAALGLTVYRIVQESLTNVLKHAGPGARAAVGVTYAPDGIGIRVIDDGVGAAPAVDHDHSGVDHGGADHDGVDHGGRRPDPHGLSGIGGHGLRGMAERVAVHHGSVSAEPRPEGGFQVLAWLPYAEPTRQLPRPRPTVINSAPPGPDAGPQRPGPVPGQPPRTDPAQLNHNPAQMNHNPAQVGVRR